MMFFSTSAVHKASVATLLLILLSSLAAHAHSKQTAAKRHGTRQAARRDLQPLAPPQIELLLLDLDGPTVLFPLADTGSVLHLEALPAKMTIEARWLNAVAPVAIEGVKFKFDGDVVTRERRHPYYLNGDNKAGKPNAFFGFTLGKHTLEATVLFESGATASRTVTFEVVSGLAAEPSKYPSAAPSSAPTAGSSTEPSASPTVKVTLESTESPTSVPSSAPTASVKTTAAPTASPSVTTTLKPTTSTGFVEVCVVCSDGGISNPDFELPLPEELRDFLGFDPTCEDLSNAADEGLRIPISAEYCFNLLQASEIINRVCRCSVTCGCGTGESPAPSAAPKTAAPNASPTTEYLINAGVDDDGLYLANKDKAVYLPGTDIVGADPYDPELFRSYRWAGKLKYSFSSLEPRLIHNVTLGFAELYHCDGAEDVGSRVMDVKVNRQQFLQDFDIVAEAGSCGTVVFENGLFKANRFGKIKIFLSASVDRPMVSLIHIVAV